METTNNKTIREHAMEELSAALITRLHEKSWNQSELARRAGVGRDAVSTYINKKALPSPYKLKRLAEALGCRTDELLPHSLSPLGEADAPLFSMIEDPDNPGKVRVRINKLLSVDAAMRVFAIIHEDE